VNATKDTSGLAGIHALAQAEATRFLGDGPVAAWRPDARMPALLQALRSRVALRSAACGAAVIVAIGWATNAPAPLRAATAPVTDDIIDDAPPAIAPSRPSAVVAAARPSLSVSHQGGWWRIDAVGASRLEAAQQLARLNGFALSGPTTRLARARPLDLRWQGHDPAAAWRALLDTEVNYALQCGRDRCRAWIVDNAGPGPIPATTVALPADGTPLPPDNAAEAPPPRDRIDPPEPLHHD